ncbi:MAG: FAD-dependent oxidoreductase [Deltaproteobacteria bacterium]|nr:FAD-dependent oxidoreductase [Deltaproteobacteria bacterium]
MNSSIKKLVVVGGDAAGMSAAVQALRSAPGTLEVDVVEAGGIVSYAACGMPYFLAGRVTDVSLLHADPAEFSRLPGLTLHLNTRAVSLDGEKKQVCCQGPQGAVVLDWDYLLIATGTRPVSLPVFDRLGPAEGVYTLRSIGDILAIQAGAADSRSVVLVGAGFISVELAEALVRMGKQVTMVDIIPFVLGPATHPVLVKKMKTLLEQKGVRVLLERTIQKVEKKKDRIHLTFYGEETLETDMVVQGVGVRPETGWLEGSGVRLGSGGAVEVDPFRRTNVEGVFAGGDASQYTHGVTGEAVMMPLALPANRSGRVAGENIARLANARKDGKSEPVELEAMPPVLGTAMVQWFDQAYARTGFTGDKLHGATVTHVVDTAKALPEYLDDSAKTDVVLSILKDGRLVGAQMLGEKSEAKRIDFFALAIGQGLDVKTLYNTDTGYAPPFSVVYNTGIKTAGKAAVLLQNKKNRGE